MKHSGKAADPLILLETANFTMGKASSISLACEEILLCISFTLVLQKRCKLKSTGLSVIFRK